MPRYFAHIAHGGAMKYGQLHGSIGVLDGPDRFMPIGEARCIAWDEDEIGVWLLRIGGQPVAGRWVIIDREFKPAAHEAAGAVHPPKNSGGILRPIISMYVRLTIILAVPVVRPRPGGLSGWLARCTCAGRHRVAFQLLDEVRVLELRYHLLGRHVLGRGILGRFRPQACPDCLGGLDAERRQLEVVTFSCRSPLLVL